MAQAIVSWLISDGRYRVHTVGATSGRSSRIIEIEDIDTGERMYGTPRRLERLFQSLRQPDESFPATTSH
jgi:hypothetical protein